MIDLNLGNNYIYIKITAQDGITTKIYFMNIVREYSKSKDVIIETSKNILLSDDKIIVDNIRTPVVTLSSYFTVSDYASFKIYSDESKTVEGTNVTKLNKGLNTYYIRLTAQDGTFQDYTLVLNRKLNLTWLWIVLIVFALVCLAVSILYLYKKKRENELNKVKISNYEKEKVLNAFDSDNNQNESQINEIKDDSDKNN
jgi:hypothetical protein